MKIREKTLSKIFAVLLIIIMSQTFFVGCVFGVSGGNEANVDPVPTERLELVDIADDSLEDKNWTQVASEVIPSVVAIISQNPTTGVGGSGSGIILSANGYIVTNAHVVDDVANEFTIILNDETTGDANDNPRYDATLIGMDTYTDLAVLKIDATGLIPATFANSNDLLIAQEVMAVGFPGGLDISPSATITVGFVSAVNRPVDMGNGYIINSIQTDAAINPGNSGGALVNTQSQVVGIPTSKIAATEYEGLGFAIPSSVAENIVNDLIEFGYVTNRATIGLGGTYYNDFNAVYYGVVSGFHIQDIYASVTGDAGVLVGDVLIEIEGNIVNGYNIINTVLQTKNPDDVIEIKVNREGDIVVLNVTLSDFHEVYGS